MAVKKSFMEIVYIPEDQLHVDPSYQRFLNTARVDAYVAEFDESLVDPVRVLKRGTDHYDVIDGQHTAEVLRRVGRGAIPCFILNGRTTVEDAASYFVTRNTGRKPLRPLEIFKAELIAKNPKAIAINEIVESFGLRITSGSPHGIAAIKKVEKVYASSPDHLRYVLSVITRTWDADDRDRLHGNIILGLHKYLVVEKPESVKWEDFIDRLVLKLKRVSPIELLRKAHASAAHEGGGNIMAAAVENEIRKATRRRRV